MPFYEYECNNEHVFDEMCSVKDRLEKKECPKCGQKGNFRISVRETQPHFGNQETLWSMRERKRKGKDNFNGHI
jgi:putative FmdB family regulatory protein